MHIDLLTRNSWPYSYENYAAKRLKKELEFFGISCSHYDCPGSYLQKLQEQKPDWTLAFEDLLGWEKPLCEILGLRHFHWETQSLAHLDHLVKSPLCEIGFHQKKEGIHFLPLPVDFIEPREKIYDTVLFLDLTEETREIVESLETRVDIFGDHKGANWLVRLKNREKIYLHSALPFSEKLQLLAMSRFVIMDELDPLFPFALAASCLPVQKKVSEEQRQEELECLTKKVLPKHSWQVSTQELLQCLYRS